MSAAGLWDVYTKNEMDDLFATWFNKFHQDLVEHGEIQQKGFDYPIPSVEAKKGSMERGRKFIAELFREEVERERKEKEKKGR
jgi:hypothetical protein